MKKLISQITITTGIITLIMAVLYYFLKAGLLQTMAITFGTTFYHFAIRLIAGYFCLKITDEKLDYKRKWFRQKSFEPKLYAILKVKRWKEKMPSYIPENFNIKNRKYKHILTDMCRAEIVHEIIIVLSFLPVLAALVWGTFWVFFITSIVAALFDLLFVIMQRFNRPRVVKLYQKEIDNNKNTE